MLIILCLLSLQTGIQLKILRTTVLVSLNTVRERLDERLDSPSAGKVEEDRARIRKRLRSP